MKNAWFAAAALCACSLQVRTAWAWGAEGHEVTGVIASFYLTPVSREKIEVLLGDKRLSDPEVSCWADDIRGTREYEVIYPNNSRWHYVDFDVEAPAEEFTATLPEDGLDIVSQIRRWQAELAAPESASERRLDALRFVAHFVADLHQPLHCASRRFDQGGNKVPVGSFQGTYYFFDAAAPMDYAPSLHTIWDEALVVESIAGEKNRSYARKLRKGITAEQLREWTESTPADWARDSYEIARDQAYHWANGEALPFVSARSGIDLTMDNYIASHLPVVREQLQKAGVRLAHLLNEALDPDYAGPALKVRK